MRSGPLIPTATHVATPSPARERVASPARRPPVVVAELVHQRLRQSGDRREAAQRGRELELALACRVHPVTERGSELALDLYERVTALDAFDALLAASALNRGIDAILSVDRAFDHVPGLERVDRLELSALERPRSRSPARVPGAPSS